MNWKPTRNLTEKDLQSGMKLVIGDGLASEAMTTLTGGTFLVAMAVLLGASNFQIGVLAALPTFTNIFQLISIWLVRRFNNRRAVSVVCSICARTPLILAGMMILFLPEAGIETVIFILFFYYFPKVRSMTELSLSEDINGATELRREFILASPGFLQSTEKQIQKHRVSFDRYLKLLVTQIARQAAAKKTNAVVKT